MKKTLFLIITVSLLCMGKTNAGNVLTIGDINIPQGGQAIMEIGCEFDTEYTAFELQIALPEGLSLLTDADGYPIIERAFDTNHILTGNLLPSNGNYKITCRSMENLSIPTNGSLFRVTVVADESLTLGANLDACVTSCEFTRTADSNGESLDDVAFKGYITEFRTILDENSTTMPEDAEDVNVRVKRTINAGSWNTICLPFAMTEEQCKAAFGDDVQLADFFSWSSDEDNDGNIVGIEIGFTYVTEIEANHPYIIKVSTDMKEFSVDGVDIEVEEEPTVQVGKKKAERGYFIGTYTTNIEVPEDGLFLSGNKFAYSAGATQLKGFSGYFELADMLTNPEEADERIVIRIGELLPGDVNGDGTVNGADIVAEINYVLADDIAGDVNGDGNVNGADIVAVINYVLNYSGGDARETMAQSRAAAVEESEEILSGTKTQEGISLSLTGGEDCTAFQFMLSLPEGVSLTAVVGSEERLGDHELLFRRQEDGRYLVLGFAMDNHCIGKSSGELLSLLLSGNANGRATVSEALIFTPQAETRYMNALDIDLPTAVSGVRAKGAAQEGDIYDLGGRKLTEKPATGVYIQGGRKYLAK